MVSILSRVKTEAAQKDSSAEKDGMFLVQAYTFTAAFNPIRSSTFEFEELWAPSPFHFCINYTNNSECSSEKSLNIFEADKPRLVTHASISSGKHPVKNHRYIYIEKKFLEQCADLLKMKRETRNQETALKFQLPRILLK